MDPTLSILIAARLVRNICSIHVRRLFQDSLVNHTKNLGACAYHPIYPTADLEADWTTWKASSEALPPHAGCASSPHAVATRRTVAAPASAHGGLAHGQRILVRSDSGCVQSCVVCRESGRRPHRLRSVGAGRVTARGVDLCLDCSDQSLHLHAPLDPHSR